MEDYKGIIDFIFKKKDEEGLIDFRNPDIDKLYKTTQKNFNNFMSFINKEIAPKKRGKLIHLFKVFNHSVTEYNQEENSLCYKEGLSDGFQIVYEILPSEIQNAE